MTRWVEETFHPHWRVALEATRVLHEVKTQHQHLVIFENPTWGTVLMLDGVCQLTTSDEFVYHEMMAHVPLMALDKPRRVLVVGGGDGGVLREVLKHPSVEKATLCEIDRAVIDTALQHYPEIPGKVFDDKRADIVIADGLKYVAETDERFDAIIVADVLEHIYNPWAALQRLKPLIAPKGAIYISLPNIRNLNILIGLTKGEWRYAESGILDITHIRFFTKAQALEMLHQTGWKVEEIRHNPDQRLTKNFEGMDINKITNFNAGNLKLDNLSQNDVVEMLTLQFLIRATPM